jgi:preprotein translocase subunit SecG
MYILMWIIHVIVCLFLIIVVLLQSGKAADLAGAFGGMGSQTAFGPRGSATLLSKATTISAILFMVTSLSLSILATRNAGLGTTVLESAPVKSSAPAPAKSAPGQMPIPASPANPAPQGQGQPITVTPSPVPAPPTPAKK